MSLTAPTPLSELENAAGRSDKRPALAILLVAGLLPDEHH